MVLLLLAGPAEPCFPRELHSVTKHPEAICLGQVTLHVNACMCEKLQAFHVTSCTITVSVIITNVMNARALCFESMTFIQQQHRFSSDIEHPYFCVITFKLAPLFRTTNNPCCVYFLYNFFVYAGILSC